MKKIISAFIGIIIALTLCVSPVMAYDSPEDIKIGLFYADKARDTVVLGCPDGFTICYGDDRDYSEITATDNTKLLVEKREGGGLIAGEVEIDSPQIAIRPRGGSFTIEGKPYRGFALIKRMSDSDLTVINVINLEEYLYSVLGGEVSPSWHMEALKAQAVCARNFAVTNMSKYDKYGFNLDNTYMSQVYGGINSEHPRTIQAVDETRGMIATYGGKPASLYFFATSGGVTANSEDIWGGSLPYLRSVPDPYENPAEATRAHWRLEMTSAQVEESLKKSNIDVGRVISMAISQKSADGRVIGLEITGTTGKTTLEREKARSVFGFNTLHSTMYDLSAPGNQLQATGGSALFPAIAVSAAGTSQLSASRFWIITAAGMVPYEPALQADTFIFTGRGWGHGVGMSQWGAKGMAEDGFTYIDILKHYFTGIDIE